MPRSPSCASAWKQNSPGGTRFIESDLDSLVTFIVASMRGIAQVFSINAAAKTKTLDTQKLMHLCEAMVDRMVVSA